MDLRVIVSPVAGVFTPLVQLPAVVSVGSSLGVVRAGRDEVAVLSPFDGVLVSMDAVDGERLEHYQRVACLRAA